jgi:hypothetical protein
VYHHTEGIISFEWWATCGSHVTPDALRRRFPPKSIWREAMGAEDAGAPSRVRQCTPLRCRTLTFLME